MTDHDDPMGITDMLDLMEAEASRGFWIAMILASIGIFLLASACLYTRTYDHEQLSLEAEHVEQAGVEWRLR